MTIYWHLTDQPTLKVWDHTESLVDEMDSAHPIVAGHPGFKPVPDTKQRMFQELEAELELVEEQSQTLYAMTPRGKEILLDIVAGDIVHDDPTTSTDEGGSSG
jgi:hypothetical protein